jgi:hypothetical protein
MKHHSCGNCLSDCWGITFWMFNRNLDARIWFLPNFGQILVDLSHLHQELMKSVGSQGSLSLLFVMRMMVCLSLLFMMKMMVQQFVIDSHKVVYDCTHVTLKIVVEISLQSHCYDVVVFHKSEPSTRAERMEGEHQSDQFHLLQQEPCSVVVLQESKQSTRAERKQVEHQSDKFYRLQQESCSIVCMYSVKQRHFPNRRQCGVGMEFLNSCICIMFPVCSHLFSWDPSGSSSSSQCVP